ncbi:MAG: hypothetical protein GY870_18520 [archaeon]|nr:hypothetical protein [archaeon]
MNEFRYLIPEPIYNDLTQMAKDGKAEGTIAAGWIFADRKENFAIVQGFETTSNPSESHIRPKSWMRMKKRKLYTMRKLKADRNLDIVWQYHTHPDGIEELHEVDIKILDYLSTGVMIVVTPDNVLGWYYDRRETKKAIIDKMIFEIISET